MVGAIRLSDFGPAFLSVREIRRGHDGEDGIIGIEDTSSRSLILSAYEIEGE
jgi:hypothetical protein